MSTTAPVGLHERLRSIVGALPDTASVTVPVADLREWLEADPQEEEGSFVADLTCDEVAEELSRTPACIRGWCRSGKLPGAYRMHGNREWRIPTGSLRAFIADQREAS